jgi:hypothetical protein
MPNRCRDGGDQRKAQAWKHRPHRSRWLCQSRKLDEFSTTMPLESWALRNIMAKSQFLADRPKFQWIQDVEGKIQEIMCFPTRDFFLHIFLSSNCQVWEGQAPEFKDPVGTNDPQITWPSSWFQSSNLT